MTTRSPLVLNNGQVQQLQAGDSLAGSSTTVSVAFINKFRNASMQVAQRGTSGSVAALNMVYTLDGWMVGPTGVGISWSQVKDSNLSGTALRLSAASGMTGLLVQQRIESFDAVELLNKDKTAQPITVQFTIYNGMASSITPKLTATYPNTRDDFSASTNDISAISLQSIAAGAVGTVAYTYTPSANIARGATFILDFGTALAAASGFVDISFADVRSSPSGTTGLNSSPQTPETRPFGVEEAWCKRFFETSYAQAQAPGTVTIAGAAQIMQYLTTYATIPIVFTARKRATPTMVYYAPKDGTTGNMSVNNNASVQACASNGWGGPTGDSVFNTPGTGLTIDQICGVHWTASAEL